MLKNIKKLATASILAVGLIGSTTVTANAATTPAPIPVSKVSPIGANNDIVGVNNAGQLVNYGPDARSNKIIGWGWKGYTNLTVTDWNKDGVQDIVTVDSAGNAWTYPGTKKNNFAPRVKLGTGLKGSMVKVVNLINGELYPQLLVLRPNGDLQVFTHNKYGGNGFFTISSGWRDFTSLQVTDWDGDRNKDIVAFHRSGDVKLYRMDGFYGFKREARPTIAKGYNLVRYRQVEQVNNFAGSGSRGLIAINTANGNLTYIGQGKTSYAAPKFVRSGWSGWASLAGHSN